MAYTEICTYYYIWDNGFIRTLCSIRIPFSRLSDCGADISHGLLFYHISLSNVETLNLVSGRQDDNMQYQ